MTCDLCGSIGELKTITTREYDASGHLVPGDPSPAFPALEQVSASLRRCPRCGAHFRWSEFSSSIQGGPEYCVEETLRRLPRDAVPA